MSPLLWNHETEEVNVSGLRKKSADGKHACERLIFLVGL